MCAQFQIFTLSIGSWLCKHLVSGIHPTVVEIETAAAATVATLARDGGRLLVVIGGTILSCMLSIFLVFPRGISSVFTITGYALIAAGWQ